MWRAEKTTGSGTWFHRTVVLAGSRSGYSNSSAGPHPADTADTDVLAAVSRPDVVEFLGGFPEEETRRIRRRVEEHLRTSSSPGEIRDIATVLGVRW